MNNIYVGTRIEHSEIDRLMGMSISRMNEKLSKKLRSSVMNKGIKKTEQGKKLLFYSVDESLYQQLLSKGVDILVKVNGGELERRLSEVNSRYSRRMDYDTSKKYKKELKSEFEKTIEVVGKDTNTRKNPSRIVGKNPYKVGDWIYPKGQSLNDSPVRISRVSEKSIWYQYPYLLDDDGNPVQHISNFYYVKSRFKNVQGWESNQEWDWTVPFKGNEDKFFFDQEVGPRRISQFDIDHPGVITDVLEQGYRSESHER